MKRLLDPLLVATLAFAGQGLLWYFGMPDVPSIPGAAPRFEDGGAIAKFMVFTAALLWAILAGKVIARIALNHRDHRRARLQRRRRRWYGGATPAEETPEAATARIRERFAYLQRVAKVAVLISILGELVYVRQLISNPAMVLDSFRSGSFTTIGVQAAGGRLLGLSSFNNLFVVAVAIFALMHFSQDVTAEDRARARRWLTGIGMAVLVHAFLFVGRQAFVSMLLMIAGAFLLSGVKKSRSFWRLVVGLGVLVAFLVWMGETLRSGSYYAHTHSAGLFSGQTQDYVLRRLVEGYFAADLNNSMVLLSCESPHDWIGSTMWASPMASLGYQSTDPATCSRWVSQFGTMNVIGNWWWDAEWWGLLFALAVGLWLGVTAVAALRGSGPPGFAAVIFLLTFPGVISLTRINYYGETIFVAPVLFMWAAWVLRPQSPAAESSRRARGHRRHAPRPRVRPGRVALTERVMPLRRP